MKKTLLTVGVLTTAVFCTLAFATSGRGPLALLKNISSPATESKSVQTDKTQTPVKYKVEHGAQINQESIEKATSAVVANGSKYQAKADSVSQGNAETVVVDLWNTATQITPLNEGGVYDATTKTFSFPASEDRSNQIISEVTGGYYGWNAVAGETYRFSGTLSGTGNARVYPCIIYNNGSGLSIWSNTIVELNEENNYTSNFGILGSNIPEGSPIMVAFLVEDGSPQTTITASGIQFYYAYNTYQAEQWNPETDIPGLGLDIFGYNVFTVTCDDGATTLGVFYDGSRIYVTGINTTATEVTIPQNITICNEVMHINYFGFQSINKAVAMSWEGAPNLKVLNLPNIRYVNDIFEGSPITDLYIGENTEFYYYPERSDIYLHIPYGSVRGNYFGFKRVLVGDEQPYYPETTNSDWVIAGTNEGEYFGISTYNGYYTIAEIFTDNESIELPVATPAQGGLYYVRYLGKDSSSGSILCANAPALKVVTIPETYTYCRVNWSYCPITELHMQGDVPNSNWSLTSGMTVYVGNQSYYTNYENNSNWYRAEIVPDGWEFEWMTINVGRKGEFAQTYIEMTDADWSLGLYVKITGGLNTTDLQNINNLTSLRKLDLSEAEFSSLPNDFLSQKNSLREIILPEYLTMIPQNSFYYCTALSKVTAPGVTYIGNNAFSGCTKLTEFDLAHVQFINSSAFYDCFQFNPTDLSAVNVIGANAFYNSGISEVIIPQGVTSISQSAFSNCSKLSKVDLPGTLTSIGNYAFRSCPSLISVNIPESVTTIGNSVFNGCTRLQEITLPSTLQSVGYDFLYGCSSLTTVKCKAVVPPSTNGDFTQGMDLNHCTLYVAPFAIDAYREASDWSDFYIIKPLNEPVKNIYINRPMSFDLLSEDNAVLQENPNMTLDYSSNSSYYATAVGQLTASGDGTLSAGIFTQYHSIGSRQSSSLSDYRTSLINNAENMRADSVVCSISFEKNKWHFISFQYDVQMSDIYGLNNTDFVIRRYNSVNRATGDGTTSNWETVPAEGVLEAGKGYIIQAANNTTNANGNYHLAVVRFPSRNTVTKNKLFTSNNAIVPLEEYTAEFAHNRSWNLVGNPYPCYFDLHYLLDDFTTPIVLWRGSNYQAYSPIDDDIILRPNEAFFVQRPLDTDQMVFGTEGRMHFDEAYMASSNNNITPGIYYAPAVNTADTQRSVFNFAIKGDNCDDRTRIVLNEEALMEYEINRDASKFFAESCQGVEIYVDGDIRYDICERPFDNGVAMLGTRIAADGIYSISLNGKNTEGWSVILTDTKTGASVDLTGSAYEFTGEAGTAAGRFMITFKAPQQSAVDSISADNFGNVRIVNIAGMVVFEGMLNDFMATAPAGTYIVIGENATHKIVIK